MGINGFFSSKPTDQCLNLWFDGVIIGWAVRDSMKANKHNVDIFECVFNTRNGAICRIFIEVVVVHFHVVLGHLLEFGWKNRSIIRFTDRKRSNLQTV